MYHMSFAHLISLKKEKARGLLMGFGVVVERSLLQNLHSPLAIGLPMLGPIFQLPGCGHVTEFQPMECGQGDISHDQAQDHKYFPLMCTPPCFFPFNRLNVRQYKLFLYFLVQNNDNNNSSKYYCSIYLCQSLITELLMYY